MNAILFLIGRHCELEENVCDNIQPCLNGGTCISNGNSYKCSCPLGYGGSDCDKGTIFSSSSFGYWIHMSVHVMPLYGVQAPNLLYVLAICLAFWQEASILNLSLYIPALLYLPTP